MVRLAAPTVMAKVQVFYNKLRAPPDHNNTEDLPLSCAKLSQNFVLCCHTREFFYPIIASVDLLF